ncbi:MAG: UbiX family flavin prenyltransferase [Saprospiraceae bacterium]|jgi:4-hydroxy-3-polyprenylbenzoate decarboxylase|nr:UbiX family flavin prenyltransferase [Saprospiraceae bacterium]MBL0189783.1 UbiX family flavin prenyltransferase [Saprospiraceae bacterium]
MESPSKIVLAIGGSSGSIYAKLLMDYLKEFSPRSLSVQAIISANAKINWELEMGSKFDPADYPFQWRENNDFFAPSASGSALIDAMVICPCSMGLLGRMAHGLSEDLITRSADVMLKERRKLIIVPRETPYNLIHLRNMTSLTEAGAIICPASPSFYSKPQTLEAAAQTVVDRVIDLIGLNHTSFRWGNSVNYP